VLPLTRKSFWSRNFASVRDNVSLVVPISAASTRLVRSSLISTCAAPTGRGHCFSNQLARRAFHHADPKIWTFATGDEKEIDSLTGAFSVYRQNEGGTISHGLATALINRDGRIERIWRGNAWTPAEIADAIQTETR
jgi:hypothetical protein